MGRVRSDGKEGGGYTHMVPATYHGKVGAENPDGKWVALAASEFLGAKEVYLEATYICHRQGKVSHWVALRPSFEFCTW